VIVISTGNALRAHASEAALGLLMIMVVVGLLSRRPGFAAAAFQLTLGLPGIGKVVRLTESVRWASMLATLLASRVTITDAILVANRIVKDSRLRASLRLVENSLRRGTRLSDALEDFTSLDPRVIEMVRIGEQSGRLDRMLTSAADLLRGEAELARKRFIALIEPMAVLVIGTCIGTIVVALMLAITSLYDKII
jgi:general secretion pathway protein F